MRTYFSALPYNQVIYQLGRMEYNMSSHETLEHPRITTIFDPPIDKVVLSNAYFECTNCGVIKHMTKFGKLRHKENTGYNQPQCISCRFRYDSLTG